MSPDISTSFILQLQKILKSMLGAALSTSKPSGSTQSRSRENGGDGGQNEVNGSPSKVNVVDALKKMYCSALKLTNGDDPSPHYNRTQALDMNLTVSEERPEQEQNSGESGRTKRISGVHGSGPEGASDPMHLWEAAR